MRVGVTNLSMRMRIVLSVTALTILIVVISSIGFDAYLGSATRATLERSLRGRMDRLQVAVKEHLIHLDPTGSGLVLEPDQSLSQIVTKGDGVVYSTIVAGFKPVVPLNQISSVGGKAKYLSISHVGSTSPFLVLIERVPSTSGYFAIVGSSTDKVVDALDIAKDILIIGSLCAVVFASVGAGLLASVVLKPVERMRKQAQKLSKDRSSDRLGNPGTGDELASLADTLNSFLSKIDESTQLQRRFIASASHELRTPLAGMKAELDSRWSDSPESDCEALLDRIDKRVDRLIYLTEGLLKVAQGQSRVIPLELTYCDLEQVVSSSLASLSHYSKTADVSLVLDVKESLNCFIDVVRVGEIVENLASNAIRHSRAGGTVEVSISRELNWATIGIRDHGEGFDSAMIGRAFEPFVSSGATNFGLGLSVVKHLVSAHQGSVEVENHEDGGALVVVRLPIGPLNEASKGD